MRFRILNKNPLYDYREACKVTEGRDLFNEDSTFKPKDETAFWIKQIVANHSTLRCIKFRLVDEQAKSVIMQIIRATKGHPQPEVQSSRPDWNNGEERSSDPYQLRLFMQDHTAESFVEMAKQRLCRRTEKRTRLFMYEMVMELRRSDEPFLRAVGYCCQPACWWYGGRCPELKSCQVSGETKLSDSVIRRYRDDYIFEEGDKENADEK